MTETKSPPEAPEVKTEVPAKPKVISTNQKFTAGQAADPSPVKTSVEPPEGRGRRAWRPKTVAEHNAYVDKLAAEQYPV